MTQIYADFRQRDGQTYSIIGAAMAVHGELGHGFLEAVYCEALALELAGRGIPFEREVGLPIRYRGILLETSYRADFVCYSSALVELKAIKQLSSADEALAINYLEATNLNRALLLNFGASSLQHKRLVLNLRKSASSADNPAATATNQSEAD
jgi:GxxExxY protein